MLGVEADSEALVVAPAASMTWASSSNDRPTVSPAPAAFSSRIGHPSTSASTSSREPTRASATAGRAVSNPLPRWLPMWRTRPSAPIPSAVARLAVRQVRDLAASSGSGDARLIRYVAWQKVDATDGCSAWAAR